MSVRRLVSALVVAAVIVGAGASSVLGARSHTQKTVVKVAASEFKFVLAAKTGPAGPVAFVVTNKGKLQHNFKISGKKTSLISPGKSATLVVTLKKGSYPYLCTVPGHAAAGMKGTFTAT